MLKKSVLLGVGACWGVLTFRNRRGEIGAAEKSEDKE